MNNRIALVTGSSRGIGRNVALRLADEMGGVLVHYHKNRSAALDVVKEIEARGKLSGCFQADLTQEDQARDFIQEAEGRFGRIDILVNNFGPILEKSWEGLSAEDWDFMWRGNLGSAYFCLLSALPGMRDRKWGRIVNMGFSRVEQLRAYRKIVPYAIAKTGLLILTRSVAASVAPEGITVNMVSPGLIEGGILPNDKNVPAGRLGTFDDVSSAVMYLVSDQARYVTGTNLVVSGGWKL
jgi:3-oxoacyl-[acyl-carrier protein] reductase